MDLPALLLANGGHQIEAAETLIQAGRFIVILFAARALAELMVRFGLPAILGELVAGVLIGVSGLHLILAPELASALNGTAQGAIASLAHVEPVQVQEIYDHSFSNLQSVGKIGLFALLFLTGLESELEELMAVGVQAITVALTGVVLPFVLGTFGLHALFGVPLLPAIFAGAAMTATSIGITASVLGELKFLRTRDGQTVIGAAVLDDILGIVILAVVVALAGGEGFALAPVLKLVAAAAVFVAVALLLSRTAAPAFDWLLDRLRAPGEVVVAAFLALSLACFAAQAFGLEAALGAFAGGLILSSSRHRHAIEQAVKPLVALFATVFFVLIGSGLDLAVLNPFDAANHEGLVMAGFLLVAAVVSKVAAGWSYLSKEPTNRLAVGLGMMPRGEVGLIFLGLGTQTGVLGPSLEAAILLMVMGTTFLAPVLLRVVLATPPEAVGLTP
ncbi:cation:proton antiporter [Synechococcus sp. L2F]|uniref:cation:proton antiporter n=1 Tax=Synechococcus sp. L2F TaxID=2823739 RepID=UPI0020CD035F|nr:cation:proton antiporter [Synechococcus sp. L2F]MCP9829665.1 cation:proton antiporter [Synechococcus sp. L2F]